MTEKCTWGSIPSSGSGEASDFLKLVSGRTYKVRPLFDPVKFFKYFHSEEGRLRTAICDKPDTCPVRLKHPELKKPSLRFAAHVIDREDGKVKIMEAPQSVFRPMGANFEMTGNNPGGGADGSDFYIKVSGQKLNTTYDVGPIKQTPLTPEEKALIKEALGGDKDKLKKIYRVNTPEEIEAKLFGDDEDIKAAKDAQSAKDAPIGDSGDAGDFAQTDDIEEDFANEW